jgi:biotin carboxyl carrier protein
MKLLASIGDVTHDVEIKRDGDRLTARVNDREYELEVSEPEPGVYLFKHDGKIIEAGVSSGSPTHVRIGSNEFDVRIIDPKRLRGTGVDSEHADGVAEIRTAMPGKVVRVMLEVGSEVEKGDGVLVVEAMKMQNELKSPKNGTIKKILVTEGSTVAAGDILATIE